MESHQSGGNQQTLRIKGILIVISILSSAPKSKRKFIMDIIMDEGKKAMDIHLSTYNERVKGCEELEDKHLAKRWEDIVFWAMEEKREDRQAALRDLEKIKCHVQAMRQKHRTKVAITSPRKNSSNSPGKKNSESFTDKKIEDRQDILRALSREFADGPSDLAHFVGEAHKDQLSQIKASYAYIHDREVSGAKKWTRFPFDVAMGRLGEIKAKETGSSKTVTMAMYENMTMNSKLFK